MSLFQPYPDKIYVGLTDKCNASCIQCWRQGEKYFYDMDDSLVKRIITLLPFIKEIGWWSAGEFFAYEKIDWLLEELKKHPNVKHSFSTNGIDLQKYANVLSRINIGEITISIDGASEETLSTIRMGVHLENIINGITEIQKTFIQQNRKVPNLKFIFVGMKRNITEFPLLVDLAHTLKVDEVWLEKLVPHPSCNLEEEILSKYPNRETEMYRLAEKKAKELGVTIGHTNELS